MHLAPWLEAAVFVSGGTACLGMSIFVHGLFLPYFLTWNVPSLSPQPCHKYISPRGPCLACTAHQRFLPQPSQRPVMTVFISALSIMSDWFQSLHHSGSFWVSSHYCPQVQAVMSQRFLGCCGVPAAMVPGLPGGSCSVYMVSEILVMSAHSQKLVLDSEVSAT